MPIINTHFQTFPEVKTECFFFFEYTQKPRFSNIAEETFRFFFSFRNCSYTLITDMSYEKLQNMPEKCVSIMKNILNPLNIKLYFIYFDNVRKFGYFLCGLLYIDLQNIKVTF